MRANRGRYRALTAVAVLLLATACTVNPVTGKSELDLMGESQEIALGRQLYPRYTQMSLGAVPDEALQRYVQTVGLRLAAVSHRPNLEYSYNAVNDPAVNAYALPGGKISITRGLLARLHNEDELAAVLGHETGHVCARHAAHQYTNAMLLQAALVGSAIYMESQDTHNRDLYLMGGLIGAQLFLAHYSRNDERQADQLGFEYMVKAGYNPEGMVELMEVLGSLHDREPNLVERMFASHPMTAERLETAERRVAEAPPEVRARPERVQPYLGPTELVRKTKDAYDEFAKGRRLLAKDDAPAAIEPLRKAVEGAPADPLPLAFLASAEMESHHPNEALTDAQRAAKLPAGQRIYFVQALTGEVFLLSRHYREAIEHLDAASTLLPDQPNIEYLRGQALEALGRREEARKAYQRVRELAPDSDLARQAEHRLSRL